MGSDGTLTSKRGSNTGCHLCRGVSNRHWRTQSRTSYRSPGGLIPQNVEHICAREAAYSPRHCRCPLRMNGAPYYSLQTKSRVGSFDSIDDGFDVVSIGESIEEIQDCEWEDVVDETERGEAQVQVDLDEGFHDAIEAAIGATLSPTAAKEISSPQLLIQDPISPRHLSARELLRDFYLTRAKDSEESSKQYRSYTPPKPPTEIAPLRAPERYDVELYERVLRQANKHKAQHALREFYAQREAAKAQRVAENRANERFVYDTQIESSAYIVVSEDDGASSCTPSLYWETTRFVANDTSSVVSARTFSA